MAYDKFTESMRKKWEREYVKGTSPDDFATARIKANPILGTGVLPGKEQLNDSDIAPVVGSDDEAKRWYQQIFKGGSLFDDGWRFGDGYKTSVATAGDLMKNFYRGLWNAPEKVLDWGATGFAKVAGWLGADNLESKTADFIAKDLINENKAADISYKINGGWINDLILKKDREKAYEEAVKQGYEGTEKDFQRDFIDSASVSGNTLDSLAQSGGEMLGTYVMSGAHPGIAGKILTGAVAAGGEVESALTQGEATMNEAAFSGLVAGAAAALLDKLGAIKLGGVSVPSSLQKALATKVSNSAIRTALKVGMDVAGEGFEEFLEEVAGKLGKKLSYESEKTWMEVFASQEALDDYVSSFFGGSVFGAFGSVPKLSGSVSTKRDYTTGLTANEQKVFDKVYNDTIAKSEENGDKLTKKEKNEIYNEVMESLQKGYITTDTIEEVLGGDSYTAYSDSVKSDGALVEQQKKLQAEFNTLNKMKKSDMTGEQTDRLEELRTQLKGIKEKISQNKKNSQTGKLKNQLSQSVKNSLTEVDSKSGKTVRSDDYLLESYNEIARKGQKFEADLSKYDKKQRAAVQRAIDSGLLNNTNKSHDMVDSVANWEAATGVQIDFSNTELLNKMGYGVKGRIVNGVKTKNGIAVNINSKKALNFIVGHELTHAVEQTGKYGDLRDILLTYAKSKGDYNWRAEAIKETYKGLKDTDIDSEIVADLVGEYIFSDKTFVNSLHKKNRNVFQRIYDEIKRLWRLATAGSREKRELEIAKNLFEDAIRENAKAKESGEDLAKKNEIGTAKYSLSNNQANNQKALDKREREFYNKFKWATDSGAMTLNEMDHLYSKASNKDDFRKARKTVFKETVFEVTDDLDNLPNNVFVFVKGTREENIEITRVVRIHSDIGEIVDDYKEDVYGHANSGTLDALPEIFGEENVSYFNRRDYPYTGGYSNQSGTRSSGSESQGNQGTDRQGTQRSGTAKETQANDIAPVKTSSQDDVFSNGETTKFPLSASNPKADQNYLSAVERGDIKTAQRIVDKAAKNEGYTIKAYHGTKADFTVFDKSKIRSGVTMFASQGDGFYFTENKEVASGYSKVGKVVDAYLKMENAFVFIDKTNNTANDLLKEFAKQHGRDFNISEYSNFAKFEDRTGSVLSMVVKGDGEAFTRFLQEKGYDGIVYNSFNYDTKKSDKCYVVFDSNQIKSADAIAYDDKGNVIPPSERFNSQNDDIRFSLSADSNGRQLSEAQRDYFKDSKVVDDNGNLKVVYHGSGAEFTEFSYAFMSTHGSMEGQGFYFTDSKTMAEGYQKNGAKLMEGYLDIKKPLSDSEMTLSRAEVTKLMKAIDPTGDDVVINYDPMGGMGYPSKTWYNRALAATVDNLMQYCDTDSEILADIANSGAGTETVVRKAREVLGYDGYIVKGKYDRGDVYVAFESNQFKNIDNLNPTSNPDVRKSLSAKGEMRRDNGGWQIYGEDVAYRRPKKGDIAPYVPVQTPATDQPVVNASIEDKDDIAPAPARRNPNALSPLKAPENKGGKSIEELVAEHGAIKQGEHPVRNDEMPKSTTGTDKVSNTARTVKGAKVTPPELVDLLDKETAGGRLSYVPITNSETVDKAYASIVSKGWEAARGEWETRVRRGEVSAELTATGGLLLNNAAKAGDTKAWLDILRNYQLMGTNAGQAVQAMRILKTLTPSDSLYMIERSVEQMVEDMKLGVEITIDENLKKAYLNAKTDAEKDAARKALAENVASQIPATASDKVTAIRYLNMLGNFRTQSRNFFGNLGMAVTSRVKNTVAATIEGIAEKASGGNFQRTKSVFVDKDLLKAAKDDFDNVKSIALNGGKFNDSQTGSNQFQQEVQDARTIFAKNKPLEKYRKATNWAMDKGDMVFSKAAYGRALAGYLQANGIKETDFSKIDQKVLDKARDYAVKEAQETTFRDNNWLSSWISKIGRRPDTPKAGRLLSEGIMPFRKTPANILLRAEEYSPLGIINATVNSIKLAKGNADVTGADVVNSWSKALTGTGLLALGMLLNNAGALAGGADEDEDKDWFETMYGWQNYAIQIGDYNFTIDFLSPSAMPLLMGAQLNELRQDGGIEMKDLESALLSIADPMIEMSMLQGINDTLENIRYSENNMGQFLINACLSYLTQGITNSFLGQLERSFEGQRMTTFVDKDSAVPAWLQKQIGKMSAKTPGWDYNQIPYVDAWGQTEDIAPVGGLLENTLSPSYISEGFSDKVYEELNRLNDAQSDINVYPQTPEKTITYEDADGVRHEDYNLSAKEYERLSKIQGQTQKALVEEIISSDVYSELTDAEKAKAIQLAYKYAKEYGRQQVLGTEGFSTKWMSEAGDNIVDEIITHTSEERTFAKENPGKYAVAKSVGGYDQYRTFSKAVNAIKEGGGNSRKQNVANYINGLDVDYGTKIILFKSEYKADDTYNNDIVEYLNSRDDISVDEIRAILTELDFTVHSNGRVTW